MALLSSGNRKYTLYDNISEISDGYIHRVESEESQYYAELVETIALSFAGSETTPPEAISDWLFCGNKRRGKHTQPLEKAPSKARLKLSRWTAKCLAWEAMEFGGCFVMVEPATKRVVGAALSYPPSYDGNNKSSLFSTLQTILNVGIPPHSWASLRRAGVMMDELTRMRDEAVSEKHWYILNLAINPQEQGKGYGSRFLKFFNALADADQKKMYLETVGRRNIAVYSKAGFKIDTSLVLKWKDDVLDEDGGVTAMVREPKNLNTAAVHRDSIFNSSSTTTYNKFSINLVK